MQSEMQFYWGMLFYKLNESHILQCISSASVIVNCRRRKLEHSVSQN